MNNIIIEIGTYYSCGLCPHCKRNGLISHLQKQAKGLDKLLQMAKHSTGKKAVFLGWNDHRHTSPLYSGNTEVPSQQNEDPLLERGTRAILNVSVVEDS